MRVHHLCHIIEDFYPTEGLGIECKPKRSGCNYGKHKSRGTNITLNEEREYHLIDKNMTYIEEEKKWEAGYPWIKDPDDRQKNA